MVELALRRRVPPRWAPYPSPHPPNPTPLGRGATNNTILLSLLGQASGSGSEGDASRLLSFVATTMDALCRQRIHAGDAGCGTGSVDLSNRILPGVSIAPHPLCKPRYHLDLRAWRWIRRRHLAFAERTRELEKIGGSCWLRSFQRPIPSYPRDPSTNAPRPASRLCRRRAPISCSCERPPRRRAAWPGLGVMTTEGSTLHDSSPCCAPSV